MNRNRFLSAALFTLMATSAQGALQFVNVSRPDFTSTLNAVACDNQSTFFAVGQNTLGLSAVFNLSSWTTNAVVTNAPGDGSLFAVTHGAGRFVAAGVNASVFYSLDHVNWIRGSNANTVHVTASGLAHNADNGRFAAVGLFPLASSSTDVATTWTPGILTAPVSPFFSFHGLTAFGANSFATCGDSGTIRVSTDGGANWSESNPRANLGDVNLRAIAADSGQQGGGEEGPVSQQLVAVGINGRVMYSLASGAAGTWQTNTWITANFPGVHLNGVAFMNPGFIVVGDGGRVFTITDITSTNWTVYPPTATTANLLGVTFGTSGSVQGLSVMVGAGGAIIIGGTPPPVPTNVANKTVCSGSGDTNLCVDVNTNGFPAGTIVVDWFNQSGALVATVPGSSPYCYAATNTIPPAGNYPSNFTYSARARDLRTGLTNASVPVTLTINPRPTSTLVSVDRTNCNDGTTYELQAALTGIGPWSVTWNDGTPQTTNAPLGSGVLLTRVVIPTNAPSANVASNNVYFVTVVTNATSCAGNQPGDIVGTNVVTVNPLPMATNVVKTICSRDAVAVALQSAVTNGVISTFSWLAAANANVSGESTTPVAGGTITDTLVNVTANPQVVNYTVTPTSANGCVGDPFTVAVTVNPHPVATNVVKTICSRDAVAVALQSAVTNGVISTFSWLAAANANVSGESTTPVAGGTITDTLVNVTANPQVVNYTVTPTSANGCVGDPFTVAVTVNPHPVATNVVKTICSRDAVAVALQSAVTNGVISTFSWLAAANANVSGESTTPVAGGTITDTLVNVTANPQVVNYTVTPTSANGCVGDPFTVAVTVNPHPVATNVVKTICSRDAVAVALQSAVTNGVISTFSWLAAANANVSGESTTPVAGGTITDTLVNVTANPQVVNYTVTPTSANGCVGDPFTVAVTVNPHPVATNVVKTICSRDAVAVALQSAVTNGVISTFSWLAAANANVSGESTTPVAGGTITDTLVNVTANPQVVNYTVTPTSANGCVGDPFTVAVTVNPHPVATNVVKTICSRDAVAVALQSAVTNGVISTFSWLAAANANVSGESTTPVAGGTITDTLVNVTANPQVVNYTVTPTSANGCVGDPFTVAVTVNPHPVATNVVKAICSGDSVAVVLQSAVTNGVISTFSWLAAANADVSGESTTPVAGGTITDTLTNLTGNVQVVVYTVTPTSANGCVGDPFTVTVTVENCSLPLSIQRLDATNVVVEWFGSLRLLSATNLTSPVSWTVISNGAVGVTNQLPISLLLPPPDQFFRLTNAP